MNRWNLAWLIGIPAAVMLGLTVSYSAPVSRENEQDYELIRLIAEVLNEVDHGYVRQLDAPARRRLVEDMINGGLEMLDPHTTFLNEREYGQLLRRSHANFGGVGITVTLNRTAGGLLVTSPMVGTPAYEAGIQPGDLIVKVNGVSVKGKRSAEAIELILGEPGTDVTLSILHDGDDEQEVEPTEVVLTRAKIEVPTIVGDQRLVDDPKKWDFMYDKQAKIGYVRITEFVEPTAKEFRQALEGLQKEGARGLVIDLRVNGGGLLIGAVDIVDALVSEGPIVKTKHRNADKDKTFTAKPDNDLLVGCPVAVLVDRFSASASEIVAAALQDHERAVIVGERSYGKGSVQNIIPIEGEKSAVKLTMASYWRPNGKNMHRFPDAKLDDDWGVRPTPGLEVTLDRKEREAWFAGRRVRDIVPGKTGHISDKFRAKGDEPFTDKALNTAVEYLRKQLNEKARS